MKSDKFPPLTGENNVATPIHKVLHRYAISWPCIRFESCFFFVWMKNDQKWKKKMNSTSPHFSPYSQDHLYTGSWTNVWNDGIFSQYKLSFRNELRGKWQALVMVNRMPVLDISSHYRESLYWTHSPLKRVKT